MKMSFVVDATINGRTNYYEVERGEVAEWSKALLFRENKNKYLQMSSSPGPSLKTNLKPIARQGRVKNLTIANR